MKTTLSIRIDADLAGLLKEESDRTQVSRAEIIRDALRGRLLKKRNKQPNGLLKFAGCISGPPDLSTNKKYLVGFGRPDRNR